MPSVNELQSIVDYTRSPDTTDSAAIDPLFNCTQISNEDGQPDYPFYWSSTTHGGFMGGGNAMYIAFGRAGGCMSFRALAGGRPGRPGGFGRGGSGQDGPPRTGRLAGDEGDYQFSDVHGAGAQRSDPKAGNASDFLHGRGPQGDVIRILNFVRLVRDGGILPR
jgi:hypothetical protein